MLRHIFLAVFLIILTACPFQLYAEEQKEQKLNVFDVIEDAQHRAAVHYKVPVEILKAIKKVESNGHPWALCVNLGGGKSYSIFPKSYQEAVYYLNKLNTDNIDIGPWQVNYRYIGKSAGLAKVQMLNPYYSALLAGYKLASEISNNGYTWHAVGNYHSKTLWRKANYVEKVKKSLRKEGYIVK